jgi:hypothetical protein
LEFKIYSNIFEFIQIAAKIFKRNLKSFSKFLKYFVLAGDLAWPFFPHRPNHLPSLSAQPAQEPLSRSRENCFPFAKMDPTETAIPAHLAYRPLSPSIPSSRPTSPSLPTWAATPFLAQPAYEPLALAPSSASPA